MPLIYVLVFSTAVIAAGVAIVTMPRWLVRTLHKDHLRRIRSEVMRDVIRGDLPRDHRAVRQLIDNLESVAATCHRVSYIGLVTHNWALKRHPDVVRAAERDFQRDGKLAGLSRAEQERVEAYRERLLLTMHSNLMFGSWLGIAWSSGILLAVMAGGAWRLIRRPFSSASPRTTPDEDMRAAVRQVMHDHPNDRLDELIRTTCLPQVARQGEHAHAVH